MSTWKPKQRPPLNERDLELIKIYEDTYGSSAPGACPEALANVLEDCM